ncbi:EAL domain-containing protein [uncultured Mailhella sp.]|uniref:EAL domain-containing protein n=1 Tax=uncultured Mailhella sp. TaxID=1981031 RepID=UPI0025CD3F52|nr:EAL domain-containing protein [uncultured Mailhella sp.]
MDVIWKNRELRQKMLNHFGDSTGECYQCYFFKEKLFYFSDNIRKMTKDVTYPSCTLEEWYQAIYPADRVRLERYVGSVFKKDRQNYHFNYRIRNRDGQLIWVSSRGKCYFDDCGNALFFLGNLSVQNVRKQVGENVQQALLLKELSLAHHQGKTGHLLMVNVDDLSRINLKYGREFGNGLLEELREAMSDTAPCFPHPRRINGSSFCVLLPETDREDVEAYFHAVQKKIEGECTISGGCVPLQTYQVPESDMLLQYAESSLESAKMAGKKRLNFFTPEDYERKLETLELLEELEAAVKRDFSGFFLVYQAQVRSETFELFGAEALLRFRSSRRGVVSPAECIPILEQSGLIVPVGLWAMRSALEQCRRWRRMIPGMRVSVNMSYRQLEHPEVQAEVLNLVRESGLPGSALTIEVTEGMELQNYPYLNAVFSAWKEEGIEVSVDDFGTGYSSLSWLKELSIDEIKIDRCFIRGIQHSAYNLRLLSNIIELAASGQIRVCCEGVETAEELAVLEPLHPDVYQGYFFARPVASDDFVVKKTYLPHHSETDGQKDLRQTVQPYLSSESFALEHAILEKTEDIISLCDIQTHEIYYLNAAGQRMFGIRDYRGRKCHEVMRGLDAPCGFCPHALLRHDSFYIWENWNSYCGRHFLQKGKLLDIGDRTLHFEVSMDITRREYVSQKSQARLDFARRITGYVEVLHKQNDWSRAVDLVLASVGEFYRADRAYLFEPSPRKPEFWDNTFEWCASGITSQKDGLQQVPPEAMSRWMSLFLKDKSVIIYNKEPLKAVSPLEWEMLSRQDIQRLIAVPLMEDGRVVGFIGVDNPRYAIEDDTQVRVLASFLVVRFQRERRERQARSDA